jgi:hypothetical protein
MDSLGGPSAGFTWAYSFDWQNQQIRKSKIALITGLVDGSGCYWVSWLFSTQALIFQEALPVSLQGSGPRTVAKRNKVDTARPLKGTQTVPLLPYAVVSKSQGQFRFKGVRRQTLSLSKSCCKAFVATFNLPQDEKEILRGILQCG